MRGVTVTLAAALLIVAASPAKGSAAILFEEAAPEWGVDFRHRHGGQGDFFMIETMGSGVVAFDYDLDGDEDLLFVDSGPLPPPAGPGGSASKLYRNDGAGRFVDVTAASAIRVDGYGQGAVAGDVDADGDLDLYFASFGPNQLLLNRGDGTFEDATAEAGVGDGLWGSSALLVDADGDRDLDLYVVNYVDFAFDDNPICGKKDLQLRSYCHPDVYDGQPDRFYRNGGDGTFEEATAEAGFGGADGKGLGVVADDFDDDGRMDLYVTNDMTANFLWIQRADGTFEDQAVLAGVAYSDRGEPEAGMGVDAADIDGDGRPDLVVTHLDQQSNALYGNLGGGLFLDRRFVARIADPSVYKVGFGVAFEDFDQDGHPDLFVANGHIIHNVDDWGTGTTFRQANQVLRNRGDGVLEEVRDAGLDAARASRGLAAADLDGDGDLDLAVSNSDDRAEIWRNVTADAGGWWLVDLEATDGDRFAVGSRLAAVSPSGRLLRTVRTASSYQSQGAMSRHFGLGDAATATLEARWPSGARQRLRGLSSRRRVRLYEPSAPGSEADRTAAAPGDEP